MVFLCVPQRLCIQVVCLTLGLHGLIKKIMIFFSAPLLVVFIHTNMLKSQNHQKDCFNQKIVYEFSIFSA